MECDCLFEQYKSRYIFVQLLFIHHTFTPSIITHIRVCLHIIQYLKPLTFYFRLELPAQTEFWRVKRKTKIIRNSKLEKPWGFVRTWNPFLYYTRGEWDEERCRVKWCGGCCCCWIRLVALHCVSTIADCILRCSRACMEHFCVLLMMCWLTGWWCASSRESRSILALFSVLGNCT